MNRSATLALAMLIGWTGAFTPASFAQTTEDPPTKGQILRPGESDKSGAPPAAGDVRVHEGEPLDCAEPAVLKRITRRFRHQVENVPDLPQVEIMEFRDIHQRRLLPSDENHPIARRYCGATVDLSDGKARDIWYLVEDGMGFASVGDNVEFCVAGFDRWYVYNSFCRVLR